jgi:hypothetical protein
MWVWIILSIVVIILCVASSLLWFLKIRKPADKPELDGPTFDREEQEKQEQPPNKDQRELPELKSRTEPTNEAVKEPEEPAYEPAYEDLWREYRTETFEPVALRKLKTNVHREQVENLFVISVFVRSMEQCSIVVENITKITALFPNATVCVVDNASLVNYAFNLPERVCFIDNTEHIANGFGYEFSSYFTALERFQPSGFMVAMQGSLLLQKPFSFADLCALQPDETKQIFSIKCFETLCMSANEDGKFVNTVAKQFDLFIPTESFKANGVFGCNFICNGSIAEDLRNGLLRTQISQKLHSQACERLLGLYMHSKQVDPLVQTLDGLIQFDSVYTKDHPYHFWKVFFGNV